MAAVGSCPWFNRRHTPGNLEASVFDSSRPCEFLDENGEDVRYKEPGVRWSLLKEVRKETYKDYAGRLQGVFDEFYERISKLGKNRQSRADSQSPVNVFPTIKTPAISKARSRTRKAKANSPVAQKATKNVVTSTVVVSERETERVEFPEVMSISDITNTSVRRLRTRSVAAKQTKENVENYLGVSSLHKDHQPSGDIENAVLHMTMSPKHAPSSPLTSKIVATPPSHKTVTRSSVLEAPPPNIIVVAEDDGKASNTRDVEDTSVRRSTRLRTRGTTTKQVRESTSTRLTSTKSKTKPAAKESSTNEQRIISPVPTLCDQTMDTATSPLTSSDTPPVPTASSPIQPPTLTSSPIHDREVAHSDTEEMDFAESALRRSVRQIRKGTVKKVKESLFGNTQAASNPKPQRELAAADPKVQEECPIATSTDSAEQKMEAAATPLVTSTNIPLPTHNTKSPVQRKTRGNAKKKTVASSLATEGETDTAEPMDTTEKSTTKKPLKLRTRRAAKQAKESIARTTQPQPPSTQTKVTDDLDTEKDCPIPSSNEIEQPGHVTKVNTPHAWLTSQATPKTGERFKGGRESPRRAAAGGGGGMTYVKKKLVSPRPVNIVKKLPAEKPSFCGVGKVISMDDLRKLSPLLTKTVTKKKVPTSTSVTKSDVSTVLSPSRIPRLRTSGVKRLRSVSLERLSSDHMTKAKKTPKNIFSDASSDENGHSSDDQNTPKLSRAHVISSSGSDSDSVATPGEGEESGQDTPLDDSTASSQEAELPFTPEPHPLEQVMKADGQDNNSGQKSVVKTTQDFLLRLFEKKHPKDNQTNSVGKPTGTVSLIPAARNSPREMESERQEKLAEKIQRKREEEERRCEELKARKQLEIQEKKKKREEKMKRVAEKQAALKKQEMEKKKKLESKKDQVEKLNQKKARQQAEKHQKLKEKMLAAESKRREEEEAAKRRAQQLEEERKMATELAIKRKELEDEEKRQKRLEKQLQERQRHLQWKADMEKEQKRKQRELEEAAERRQAAEAMAAKKAATTTTATTTANGGKGNSRDVPNGNTVVKKGAEDPKKRIQDLFGMAGKLKATVPLVNAVNISSEVVDEMNSEQEASESTANLNSTFTKEDTDHPTATLATTPANSNHHYHLMAGSALAAALAVKNDTVGAGGTQSYAMTPADSDPLYAYENYDIGTLSSDDSTDDEDCPKKSIPPWAESRTLASVMLDQEAALEANCIDINEIFPPEQLLQDINLSKIFKLKRKRFHQRSSSAHWNSPLYKKGRLG